MKIVNPDPSLPSAHIWKTKSSDQAQCT